MVQKLPDWWNSNKPYRIMDCLEGMREIPDDSVDLILTDPPYGINYFSNYYKKDNPHEKIIGDDSLNIPFNEFNRIIKNTGCMFIFFSHKEPIKPTPKNTIIWVKNNWTAGNLKGDFGNQYECIAFYPQSNFKLNGKRYSNIWSFDRVPPNALLHPTQKPIKLINRLISCSTKPDDIVLDPFLGSGTTLRSCRETNRIGIGFELNLNYEKTIRKRSLLDIKTLEEFI